MCVWGGGGGSSCCSMSSLTLRTIWLVSLSGTKQSLLLFKYPGVILIPASLILPLSVVKTTRFSPLGRPLSRMDLCREIVLKYKKNLQLLSLLRQQWAPRVEPARYIVLPGTDFLSFIIPKKGYDLEVVARSTQSA